MAGHYTIGVYPPVKNKNIKVRVIVLDVKEKRMQMKHMKRLAVFFFKCRLQVCLKRAFQRTHSSLDR